MYVYRMMGLKAVTSIHAGASGGEYMIDLPIQRERHTGWPTVFGSSMKGALRSHFSARVDEQLLVDVFGPDTSAASEHAGAAIISDAKLLALPMRSINSGAKLVTSPGVIERLLLDCRRVGIEVTLSLPSIADDKVIVPDGSAYDKTQYIEDYAYAVEPHNSVNELVSIINKIVDQDIESLTAKLVVVSDAQFAHLCTSAVPVNTHIAIESETKTVKAGALWSEESLPAQSLMYTVVGCTNSRSSSAKSAIELLSAMQEQLTNDEFVQVGGNETVGMGWFQVNFAEVVDA